jgi:hypothetical protein
MKAGTRWTGLAIGLGILLSMALVFVTKHTMFMWDEFGHRGIYLCGTERASSRDMIERCSKWRGDVFYSRTKHVDGSTEISWYAESGGEFLRIIEREGLPSKTYRRELADCWQEIGLHDLPFGRSGISALRNKSGSVFTRRA